jgi:RecA/RadA recombinase
MAARALDLSKFRKEQNKKLNIKDGFFDPITWISTGNYALNKMISGNFHWGIPIGSVTCFAGESGSGKSFLVSGNIVRNALEQGVSVVLLDSEDAVKRKWAQAVGVNPDHPNLIRWNKNTINQVALVISDFMKDYASEYRETPREEQPPVLFVIDSLGHLNSDTDAEQFQKGDLKGDKGIKAKGLKMLMTNCIRLFSGFQIGLVCTNHTYKSQDMYAPDDVISGGCLVPETPILMANGTKKPIKEVVVGDELLTLFGCQSVTKLWQYQKPTFTFELSDGQQIQCSPEHRLLILSEKGHVWKTAKEIEEGDEILAL